MTGNHPLTDTPRLQEESASCKVRIRDQRQVEIQSLWPLGKDQERHDYELEMYLFVPPHLRVNSTTFTPREFYSDMFQKIQYAPADFSPAQLLSENEDRSPFTRLADRLDVDFSKRKFPATVWIYELKALGCIFRTYVRSSARKIRKLISESRKNEAEIINTVVPIYSNLMEDSKKILSHFREFRETATPKVPPEVEKSFGLLDEYLSLNAEYGALRPLKDFQELKKRKQYPGFSDETKSAISQLESKAKELIDQEINHRKQSNYATVVDTSDSTKRDRRNEHFHFRKRLLRRYTETILALQDVIGEERARRWAVQFAYSIAAAIAMAVAVAGAYLTGTLNIPTTITGVILVMIAYAFKDRVKDIMRAWISSRFSPYFPERKSELWDPLSKNRIGMCMEDFDFADLDRLPSEIQNSREGGIFPDLCSKDIEKEKVLKYDRKVHIKPRVIFSQHRRTPAIRDTVILNLRQFMHHAGDPVRPLLYIKDVESPESTQKAGVDLGKIGALKSNYINMIICQKSLHGPNKSKSIKRYRIAFHRDGLERIEEIKAGN